MTPWGTGSASGNRRHPDGNVRIPHAGDASGHYVMGLSSDGRGAAGVWCLAECREKGERVQAKTEGRAHCKRRERNADRVVDKERGKDAGGEDNRVWQHGRLVTCRMIKANALSLTMALTYPKML